MQLRYNCLPHSGFTLLKGSSQARFLRASSFCSKRVKVPVSHFLKASTQMCQRHNLVFNITAYKLHSTMLTEVALGPSPAKQFSKPSAPKSLTTLFSIFLAVSFYSSNDFHVSLYRARGHRSY